MIGYKGQDGKKKKIQDKLRIGEYLRIIAGIVIISTLLTSNVPQARAATDWDIALDHIHSLHGDYLALQETIKLDKQIIGKLHKQNNDDLKSVNVKLQSIDHEQLTRLKLDAEAARRKHAPLLTKYKVLGEQAAAARKANDVRTATLLDLKRNKLKAAAMAARAEVKTKLEVLDAARKQTAGKTKPAKDALAAVPALKKQITTGNKDISAAQKIRSEADKRYKAGIKQGDAVTAAAGMKSSYDQMGIIHAYQQKILGWEKQISQSLRTAESRLPN